MTDATDIDLDFEADDDTLLAECGQASPDDLGHYADNTDEGDADAH